MSIETLRLLAAGLRFDAPDFSSKYADLLCQINDTLDQRELKNQLLTYAESQGKSAGVAALHSSLVGLEGKIAFCLNHGAVLRDSSTHRVHQLLDQLAQKAAQETPQWETLPITNSTKQRDQYVNCYSRIDNLKTQVLKGQKAVGEVSRGVREIVGHFAPTNRAVHRMLVEHYATLLQEARADPTIATWAPVLHKVTETLQLMISNKSSIKQGKLNSKQRVMLSTVATRDKQGTQAAGKIKLKSEDTELGITSIDPTNVIGAELVVVYNTKTHHVEVYRATGEQRLSIQGSRVTNFDPALSEGRALREPSSWLPRWTAATTIRRCEVLMQSLKGKKWTVSGKLNSNHLILKVL